LNSCQLCRFDRKVVFALGDADFDSKKTIHVAFKNYFVEKVRSLGYKVLYVNEYYTSQKAPCCGNQTEFFGVRVKYCRNCHKFFHRDVMAGENMVNVARSILVGGSRPAYLTKPPPENFQKLLASLQVCKTFM
jgi:hypothetical protein